MSVMQKLRTDIKSRLIEKLVKDHVEAYLESCHASIKQYRDLTPSILVQVHLRTGTQLMLEQLPAKDVADLLRGLADDLERTGPGNAA